MHTDSCLRAIATCRTECRDSHGAKRYGRLRTKGKMLRMGPISCDCWLYSTVMNARSLRTGRKSVFSTVHHINLDVRPHCLAQAWSGFARLRICRGTKRRIAARSLSPRLEHGIRNGDPHQSARHQLYSDVVSIDGPMRLASLPVRDPRTLSEGMGARDGRAAPGPPPGPLTHMTNVGSKARWQGNGSCFWRTQFCFLEWIRSRSD